MEAEIKKLQKRYQVLADNNTNLLCQISALRENSNQLANQPETIVEHCTTPQAVQKPGPSNEPTDASKTTETSYNIPVENKFEKLAEKLDETSIPDTLSNKTTHTKPPPTKTSPNENHSIVKTPSNTNQDPTSEHPRNKGTNKTIVLCDSNGRDINSKLLCPDSKVNYLRCPTLPQAEKIINNLTDDHHEVTVSTKEQWK